MDPPWPIIISNEFLTEYKFGKGNKLPSRVNRNVPVWQITRPLRLEFGLKNLSESFIGLKILLYLLWKLLYIYIYTFPFVYGISWNCWLVMHYKRGFLVYIVTKYVIKNGFIISNLILLITVTKWIAFMPLTTSVWFIDLYYCWTLGEFCYAVEHAITNSIIAMPFGPHICIRMTSHFNIDEIDWCRVLSTWGAFAWDILEHKHQQILHRSHNSWKVPGTAFIRGFQTPLELWNIESEPTLTCKAVHCSKNKCYFICNRWPVNTLNDRKSQT